MTLYEIDNQLMQLIDQETGEIADMEAFEDLQLERDAKIENVALWVKNLRAESAAIKAEEEALSERRARADKKAEHLEEYLKYALQGEKFKTPKVDISYRKSSSVEVGEGFVTWARANDANDLLTVKEPTPNKTAIKAALKEGREIPAAIIEKMNMTIK